MDQENVHLQQAIKDVDAAQDLTNDLRALVETTVAEGASDLHLTVGYHPTIRVSGALIAVSTDAAEMKACTSTPRSLNFMAYISSKN